jgi:hypothetical protein
MLWPSVIFQPELARAADVRLRIKVYNPGPKWHAVRDVRFARQEGSFHKYYTNTHCVGLKCAVAAGLIYH